MATYTLWGTPAEYQQTGRQGVRFPTEMTSGDQSPSTGIENRFGRGGLPGNVYVQPIHTFDCDSELDAQAYFQLCQARGVPHGSVATVTAPDQSKLWRYRGANHYQIQQGARLKIAAHVVAECRHNRECKDLQVELAGLCERYHKSRGHIGSPSFNQPDVAVARATLSHAERHASKLMCAAASAVSSLDEAYQAFGLEVPNRGFAVLGYPEEAMSALEAVRIALEVRANIESLESPVKEDPAQIESNPEDHTPAPANGQPAHHHKRDRAGAK